MKCTVLYIPDAGRFVAGMSFLIGGILLLAGIPTDFPFQNTLHKSTVSKMNTPVKPAAAADLPTFTAGNFSSFPGR